MAITMAKDKAGDAVGMVHRSRPSAPTIQWENFNFPCKREPFNIIHFDLQVKKGPRCSTALVVPTLTLLGLVSVFALDQELKTITERGFFAVRRVLAWHYATLAIVLFHCTRARCSSLCVCGPCGWPLTNQHQPHRDQCTHHFTRHKQQRHLWRCQRCICNLQYVSSCYCYRRLPPCPRRH